MRFFHKLVVPTQSPDSHPKIFSSSVAISPSYWPFQYTDIFESPCIETQRFKISVFYTRIFFNLRVLKHGDAKISVFYTQRFLNICVLKHGDS